MKESQFFEKVKKYLSYVVQQNGSDLHLSVGDNPIIRIDGKLHRFDESHVVTKEEMEALIDAMLNEERKEKLLKDRQVDFSLEVDSGDRFRANVFFQKNNPSLSLRLIPKDIKTLKELNVPEIAYKFADKTQGLFLVTGPTGHGKSTTLASLIEYINQTKQKHIITIEDPIEYVFESKKSLIHQREVFEDAKSFNGALRACFREDVDVIMVGEMRDLETISTAITAAETGHLILATLHTNDSVQTIDRIIDVFPAYQQNQIRLQLSNVLLGVLSQRLLKRIGGGRIPATEIMIKNHAIDNMIRQGQTHQINVVLDTSLDEGMVSINRSLAMLVKEGYVALEEAEPFATDVNSFRMLLESDA